MTISDLNSDWDVVVVGGGITGAAIFREAARMGLSVLLVEQSDYSWGTSSRSSKMIHGGLRYLISGQVLLSLASVKERERLLAEGKGLIEPLQFLTAVYKTHGASKNLMSLGLSVYSLMARKRQHIRLTPEQTQERIPSINTDQLDAGFCFGDAQTDDSRLVLRLITEGCAKGGTALNYTRVRKLERNRQGRVSAVTAEDAETGESVELRTKVVINATGAWAESLHPSPVEGYHLRPLRGSHLLFPESVLSLDVALTFFHPADSRPVFIYPWEGCLVLGTTDVDHVDPLDQEPSITREEAAYLMDGLEFILPGAKISESDCISSMAGVRPVLSKGGKKASKETRDYVVWRDRGLVTVTGGKLTTFRVIARDALKAACKDLPGFSILKPSSIFDPAEREETDSARMALFPEAIQRRLYGRYGSLAAEVMNDQEEEDGALVPGTATPWCELSYAASQEQVRHLSDLLLRRVRIGLLSPGGGEEHFERIETTCKKALSWDDSRWEEEKRRYLEEWRNHYAPPF
jgi:glycerol-3-phosphate dehydrogenase